MRTKTTAAAMNENRFPGWIPELFCGILILLLPVKFGALAGPPAVTMIYWQNWISILLSPWPWPVFPPLTGVFLLISLFAFPGPVKNSALFRETGLLLILAVIGSAVGMLSPLGSREAERYFFVYGLGIAAFTAGTALLLSARPQAAVRLGGWFTAGFILTLISGMEQYFCGFQETSRNLMNQWAGVYGNMDSGILMRLKEMRVSAGFSACNAYAGYLAFALPVVFALLRKAARFAEPEKVSRWVLTLPVLACGLFLLVKTGSRGGLLSLTGGLFLTFFLLKTGKRWKILLGSALAAAATAFVLLILWGRGGKSLLFRMDYFQGAFRMMLDHPITGTGWGGFQRQFMFNKLIEDAEAPASPHNLLLSFGSQSGVLFFLLACAAVLYPLIRGGRRLRSLSPWEAFSEKELLPTLFYAGTAALIFQSMQDVMVETLGCAALGSAALLVSVLPEAEPGERPFSPWFRRICRVLSYLLCIGTLFAGFRLLKGDMALARLNDMTDFHMMSEKEWAAVDPEAASRSFEECRKANPDSPYPYLTLSSFLFSRGDAAGSLMLLDRALQLDPGSSGLWFRSYRQRSRLPGCRPEALAALEEAVRLFPKNPKYRQKLQEERSEDQ